MSRLLFLALFDLAPLLLAVLAAALVTIAERHPVRSDPPSFSLPNPRGPTRLSRG